MSESNDRTPLEACDETVMLSSQTVSGDSSAIESLLRVEAIENEERPGRYRIRRKSQKISFDKGFYLVVKALQLLRKHHSPGLTIVGLGGPSGSGKSSLAKKIREVIPKTLVISLDNYLDSSRKVIDRNFDDYRLVDFELVRKNLQELIEGKTTQLPLYDFRKSGRYAYVSASPPESKILIVEGIYALHEQIRPFLDLKIAISGGVHADLVSRVFRDIQRTGQQMQEIMQQITETVFPMYKAYIEPDLLGADMFVNNNFNPFGGFLHPQYLLKANNDKFKITTEQVFEVLKVQADEHESLIRDEETSYDIYLKPPAGAQPGEGAGNWIRIRNSGGRYKLLFQAEVKEPPFLISPRVQFLINVKVLGGLMALGYETSAILHRTSTSFKKDGIRVSFIRIDQLPHSFIQIRGTDREKVQLIARNLGLTHFVDKSYIELHQLLSGTMAPSGTPAQQRQSSALDKFLGTAKL
eukprot:CAMPEP_0177668176 /NCGR_PEP_ID=MMETSP0447-20121125/22597_1 /TAXON_ID=0 /ORGANISM="Stygamoeba regulata, Strain BSH-02190019" /LENGTH=467 /DNA_ID=CAMNT_0019174617 /DNA_START=53 /DNA_END=1456 /DNA_ORIENTATION=-